jgi:hemerythrin-like metal-binding protein
MDFQVNLKAYVMDKIGWKKEYSSGLNYLDNHRRNYLDIVNELVDISNSKNCETRLPFVFHRLAFYIEDYFSKKEMAIREAPSICLSDYKKEHNRFNAGISRFQERYRQGEYEICDELIEFMMGWFLNYITLFGSDAPDYMRSKGFE